MKKKSNADDVSIVFNFSTSFFIYDQKSSHETKKSALKTNHYFQFPIMLFLDY